MVTRRELNLLIGCMAVFVALFIINYVDFIQRKQENDYVYWDLHTLTSGDYTVEVDIGPDFYNKYQRDVEDDWLEKCDKGLLGKGHQFESSV